ncbi:molybdenum cofactor biosynthesis protein MoaE [Candidatus Omnitrophota bacterium]
MVEITKIPISPEILINKVKTNSSGCVLAYVGVIRDYSRGKRVLSVEYEDPEGVAQNRLQEIVDEVRQNWPLENITICHRIGKLNVGDINIVIAIASAHRQESFAACQHAIDCFKQKLPTKKKETYQDGSIYFEGE